MTLPLIRHEQAAQVGMTNKVHPHEVKKFAFEPASAGPNWDYRFDVRIVPGDAGAEADFLAFRNGCQVVLKLEAGLNRKTVYASDVRKKIKLQGVTTLLGGGAQKAMGNNNSGLTAEFDYVLDRSRIPRPQMLDDSTSALVCVRHSFSFTRYRLFVPVQRALFPEIEVTNQQDGDVNHHFQKAVPSQTAKNIGPWVKKDGFHIE